MGERKNFLSPILIYYFCIHIFSFSMQVKTAGIVLHSLKYSDSATIVTIYTRQHGRASYMVYGVNKKNAACKPAFLQPLSLVELDASHLPGKEIQRIKEVRILHSFSEIPFDPVKNSIALFLSEVLFRVLRQSEPDEEMFSFLENSIRLLDSNKEGIANFHLVFLMELTRYLGCCPNHEKEASGYFDLSNGIFLRQKPLHIHFLMPEESSDILKILQSDYETMNSLVFSRKRRSELLESIIEYYKLHIPDFNGLHSLEVLQSLFD